MKIALVQIQSLKGAIDENIEKHVRAIHEAVEKKADIILFPELSLTAYEPSLAKESAISINDQRLDVFQDLSDANDCTICIGAPSVAESLPKISLFIFQAKKERIAYDKQLLHKDELPFFEAGNKEVQLLHKGFKISPAICYESLQESHNAKADSAETDLYLVSVAKDAEGMKKANAHFSNMAKKYQMHIALCNSVGPCDNFESSGGSAFWNEKGEHIGGLLQEGILFVETSTNTSSSIIFQ